MARKDDLIVRLREMAGTPSEMAAALGVEASDRTFSRALKELEDEGALVAEGTTRDRRYRNAATVAREDSPRKARICPKCNRRNFGDLAWTCPEHGVAEDQADVPYFGKAPVAEHRPTPDEWAGMAATASEPGVSIGQRPKGDR
jgi:hypothetical protein